MGLHRNERVKIRKIKESQKRKERRITKLQSRIYTERGIWDEQALEEKSDERKEQ